MFQIYRKLGKGWLEGLTFKLQQNGISARKLYILREFLNDRKKGVKLTWAEVNAARWAKQTTFFSKLCAEKNGPCNTDSPRLLVDY